MTIEDYIDALDKDLNAKQRAISPMADKATAERRAYLEGVIEGLASARRDLDFVAQREMQPDDFTL